MKKIYFKILVIILIIMVQGLQSLGNYLYKKLS